MSFSPRKRLVNPRLGTYFGIFTSLLVSLVLLVAMLEQLGINDTYLRFAMFGVPLVMYAAFALAGRAATPEDFFAAGRRIPPFFSGLVLAITALGGTGIIALTGCIFLIGSDAFALLLGWATGIVFMAVLLVPFLRKFGPYTVPSYLGARFESPTLRILSAAILAVPVLLLLAAEIRIAAFAGGVLTGSAEWLMIPLLTAAAALSVLPGGMRSLTWASAAKALAALAMLVVPVTLVAMAVSNLPIPQMTAGNYLRNIAQIEIARGVPSLAAGPLAFDLPTAGQHAIAKRFLNTFGTIGPLAYSASILVIACGIAGAPTLLARAGTTVGVHDARKSMGWASLIIGFTILTLLAIAIFMRGAVIDQVVSQGRLPDWIKSLEAAGLAKSATRTGGSVLSGLTFHRDGILAALPIAAGLPATLTYLALAGAIAAALTAMAAAIATLGSMIAEDVIQALAPADTTDRARLIVARVAMAVSAAAGAMVAFLPADPLQLVLWSLAMTASASFPVLVLSVLWKRLNAWGAMAGLGTGLIVVVLLMLLNQAGVGALSGPLPAAFAMPAAVIAAVIVTRITPGVGRTVLELVRDMRIPGGETLADRRARLDKLRQQGR